MEDRGPCLADMTDAEFESYIEATIADYAREGAKAVGMEAEAAVEKARSQISALLPAGQRTSGQHIRKILDPEGERAGVLWYAERMDEEPPCLFAYEIAINETHRGRGFGSAIMLQLEAIARDTGFDQIKLHVFTHNEGAVRLYRRLGYTVDFEGSGGVRMVKQVR